MAEELSTGRDLELDVVKAAFYIENNLKDLKQELRELHRRCPSEPRVPKTLEFKPKTPQYPQITPPDYLFQDSRKAIKRQKNTLYAILGIMTMFFPPLLFAWVPILYWIWGHYDKKAEEKETPIYNAFVNNVKNSEEYISTCKKIDEQTKAENDRNFKAVQEKNENNRIKYESEKKEYDEELLPRYQSEEQALKAAIESSEEARKELYDKYRVIPAQYHNLNTLAWITLYMHTSQFDLKSAIERWDAYVDHCQREKLIEIGEAQLYVLEEQLKYQENTYYLNKQLVELSEQSNSVLSSIGIWQKAYMLVNEYRYQKAKRLNKPLDQPQFAPQRPRRICRGYGRYDNIWQ